MTVEKPSLAGAARAVLLIADPEDKAAQAEKAASEWFGGHLDPTGVEESWPRRPQRPALPELRRPGDMPRRRTGGKDGRIALLHALAHIELNAIDLAFDLIGRFTCRRLPTQFYNDWVRVGADEARHFRALQARLRSLGSTYGALPAHDGLWEAAEQTSHDLSARLAIIPMVLEARGLDVTDAMIERLKHAGDGDSAKILAMIQREEQEHVAAGVRWFRYCCEEDGLAPESEFQRLVRKYFQGLLKPPFNQQMRSAAGLTPDFYLPLVDQPAGAENP